MAATLPPMATPVTTSPLTHIPTATRLSHGGGGEAKNNNDDDAAALRYLANAGFPRGLANLILESREAFIMRYWIVDNSGSMMTADGHTLDRRRRAVNCTRWEELRSTVTFHAALADLMRAPTEFRLLNPVYGAPQVISVGGAPAEAARSMDLVHAAMASDPAGKTPLCGHLRHVRQQVKRAEGQLRRTGGKAVVVIATDGCPTDGDLGRILKTFEGLPVWVVVRLCTDDDDVVEYWNNVDADVEVDMDVLDDLEGEAKEVCGPNPWLNYALPLHRAREWGLHKRVFDLLDEKALSADELVDLCQTLFDPDGALRRLRDPARDWPVFETEVRRCLEREKAHGDPLKNYEVRPWLNLARLRKKYRYGAGPESGCCVIA